MIQFPKFPKIARMEKALGCVITEKIDGTNASVHVIPLGTDTDLDYASSGRDALGYPPAPITAVVGTSLILSGSRNRWITPGDDNAGFARWVHEHAEELVNLGPGAHYGEWYGQGIQRNYGLAEKRFALFNVGKWNEYHPQPDCCETVPVLWQGQFNPGVVRLEAYHLQQGGSHVAATGWDGKPEGVMVYLTGLGTYLKHPHDPKPKGNASN